MRSWNLSSEQSRGPRKKAWEREDGIPESCVHKKLQGTYSSGLRRTGNSRPRKQADRSLYGGKRNPSRYLPRWVSDWGVGTSVFIHEQVMRSTLKTFLEILSLIEMLRTPWQGSLVVMVFFASRRSLYWHLPSHTTPCILFPFPFFCSLTHVLLPSLASWSSWFSFHLH